MAKKLYAIRKGKVTGIVYSWEECLNATAGYSGAEYRGFNNEDEANAYLNGRELARKSNGQTIVISKPEVLDEVNIYTDGSYKDGFVSVGIYLETREKSFRFYGLVDARQYSSINNIAGELFAVLVGVQLAKDMGYYRLNILYDQDGVENWVTGGWKANGELQSIYASLMRQYRIINGLTFNFLYVRGHSGIYGNNMADKMANRARNFNRYIDTNKILQGRITASDVPLF